MRHVSAAGAPPGDRATDQARNQTANPGVSRAGHPGANGPADWAIETRGLRKSYGGRAVLDGLDLRVRRGGVFALLGQNGAGKTTTVRILTTLTRADAGRARVAGFDVVAERSRARRALSLTGQYAALDEEQTGEENLRMMARLVGADRATAAARATELLARFDLREAAGRRVATYSGGMRRRLDIAAGLTGAPEVVFLDEPTTGLDPRGRRAMWRLVGGLAESGVTIFLTTQYLEEADQLADHVALLDQGRLVAEGTPRELKERVAGQRLDLTLSDPHAYRAVAERLGERAVFASPEELLLGVATDGGAAGVRALLDELDPGHRDIARFAVRGATLDDVFLELTQHGPAH
ncbi:ATP-binding cassette domain-containing protein [Streptomyces sp. AJS327]|uniref:ATP-binding cassette domain-containing protein n=1 Tax=Streptomyces sp. AJS327 TaxID=2545265 RepID=UPI0015E054D0|nr:ATP-binding cassette domain-containing protein [Streptomyces sp. AJS327]MBA0049910.1 ATP-binding cassette domain-containing protein [Streptomyces sp. AJS327]